MAYRSNSNKPETWWDTIKEFTFLLLLVFIIRTIGFGLYQVPTGSMETTLLVGERFFADKFTPLFSKPVQGSIIAFNDPLYNYSKNGAVRLFQEYVWGPMNWTKRVIAVPGDRVRGVIEDGKPVVYVNDKKLHEPYLNTNPLLLVWTDEGGQVVKSFDPSLGYNEQKFYSINPEKIVIVPVGTQVPGSRVDDLGRVFKDSGLPVEKDQRIRSVRRDKSYWNGTDEFYVELSPDEYWCMGDNRRGSFDCRFFGPVNQRLIHAKIVFRIWSIDSYESWWIWDLIKHPVDFWKRMRWNRFFQMVR